MPERLTVEAAQNIDLPSWVHPIQRVRRIRSVAEKSCATIKTGLSQLSQYPYTRTGLVKRAQRHHWATEAYIARMNTNNQGEQSE